MIEQINERKEEVETQLLRGKRLQNRDREQKYWEKTFRATGSNCRLWEVRYHHEIYKYLFPEEYFKDSYVKEMGVEFL